MSTSKESERSSKDTAPQLEMSSVDMDAIREACLQRQLPLQFDVNILLAGNLACGVHEQIFVSASPVFQMVLKERKHFCEERAGVQDKSNIKLEMDPDVFLVIRYFLYCDELPLRMLNNLDLALQVLEASFHYSIDPLMKLIIAHLEAIIAPKSAFKILQSARTVKCSALEELALETIYRNPDQLLTNKDFLCLGCYDVSRILSSDELSCPEADVFQAAYFWALHQAKATHSGTPSASVKYYFSQVSIHIRFPLMTPKQLAAYTATTGDLIPAQDVINLFQRILLPEFEDELATTATKYNGKPRSHVFYQNTDKTSVSIATQTEGLIPDGLHLLQTPPPQRPSLVARKHANMPTGVLESVGTTPIKLMRVQAGSENYLPVKQICFNNEAVSSYEDVVPRFISEIEDKDKITSVTFSNLSINKKHKRVLFRNCREINIDAKCSFFKNSGDASFVDFVSHFDPTRYLLFDNNAGLPMTPENIWGLKQDILLKFNGVVFLNVKHLQEQMLVLNYISDWKRIMSHANPRELALSNSEFSVKLMNKKAVKNSTLEKLTLYRVWGDFTLEEIMENFPYLEELCVWKHVRNSPAKEISKRENSNLKKKDSEQKDSIPEENYVTSLTLNFSNKISTNHSIRKLALFRTELKFPIRCTSAATSVTELVLDLCYTRDGDGKKSEIADVFHQVFPYLEKLVLLNDLEGKLYKAGNIPVGTPSLVNCAIEKIKSLKEILVRSLRWGENEVEDGKLATFLEEEANLPRKPKNFRLEKSVEGVWRGSRLDEHLKGVMDVDKEWWTNQMEYDCYNLDYFYDSVESFELYFMQNNFPKPILWI